MNAATKLSSAFLAAHPQEAAQVLQAFPAAEVAPFLEKQAPSQIAAVMENTLPYIAAGILEALDPETAAKALTFLSPEQAIPPLRHLSESDREKILTCVPNATRDSYRSLLQWPAGSAGSAMNPFLLVLTEDMTISEAMRRTRNHRKTAICFPYVVDAKQRLVGSLSISGLMRANPSQTLKDVIERQEIQLLASTSLEMAVRNLNWRSLESIPVVDEEGILLGAIKRETLEKAASRAKISQSHSPLAEGLLSLSELYGRTAIELIPLIARSAFLNEKRENTQGPNGHN